MQIETLSFAAMMLCAFASGMLGAAVFCLITSLLKKRSRKTDTASNERKTGDSWQRISRDEQLYNGR